MDQTVLAYFREGGEIASGSEWARIEEMLRTYPAVEHLDSELPGRPPS